LFVEDEEFDIQPYFAAAKTFDYDYFCFLNSFSVLLDEDWLLKLYRHIVREGVGVVSAQGLMNVYTTIICGRGLLNDRCFSG
jgi:hypothetical protein